MKQSKKSTKQLLEDALRDLEASPLYNRQALDELKQNFNKWQQKSVRPDDRENWQAVPQMVLGSQTPRELLYTPLSNPDFDYGADLGNSGEQPFTRGIHANKARPRYILA